MKYLNLFQVFITIDLICSIQKKINLIKNCMQYTYRKLKYQHKQEKSYHQYRQKLTKQMLFLSIQIEINHYKTIRNFNMIYAYEKSIGFKYGEKNEREQISDVKVQNLISGYLKIKCQKLFCDLISAIYSVLKFVLETFEYKLDVP